MKENFLDLHSYTCDHKDNDPRYRKECEWNPERFLFFLGDKFFLVTYYSCVAYGDHIGFRRKIIESAKGQKKIFVGEKTWKSIDINKELKDFRIRNKSLRKWIEQVHYIYADNAKKKYCLSTKVNLFDHIINESEIEKNYDEAVEFLENNEYQYLIPELKELHHINTPLWRICEVEVSRTIDHLVKSINELTL
jgi:hypothetical protein